MRLPPEGQGTVAFTLGCCEVGRDFKEGNNLDGLGLDDALWLTRPVGDDAQVAGLGKSLPFGLIRPECSSCRALRSPKHQLGEFPRHLGAVAKEERLVVAPLGCSAVGSGKLVPEGRKMHWYRHVSVHGRTAVSYAAHTRGTRREPHEDGTSHAAVRMSDSLGGLGKPTQQLGRRIGEHLRLSERENALRVKVL